MSTLGSQLRRRLIVNASRRQRTPLLSSPSILSLSSPCYSERLGHTSFRMQRGLFSQSSGALATVSASNYKDSSNNSDTMKRLMAIGAVASVLAGDSIFGSSDDKKADCCGIAAVVASDNFDSRHFLLEALTILKNRGYDSAGIATAAATPGTPLSISKYASDGDNADGVDLVRTHSDESLGHVIGIAHTRWATHGGKTDENAHPHTDSSGKIALVHNGTINNANELRKELKSLGHKFTSQTDTEVIAKLIGHIRDEEKLSVFEATEKALTRCDGTWGLCILCDETPNELVVACNGSPLVIGLAQDKMFVASETSAFNRYTKNFISMKDGEIGILNSDGRNLDLTRIQEAPDQKVELSPAPFPHWTLKELKEQPEALARALGFGGRLSYEKILLGGFDSHFESLSKIKHLTLSACGTSLNASKYAEKLMKALGCFDSVVSIDAAETTIKDFPNVKNPAESGLLVVSQSGETKDVQRVVNTAMKNNITAMSVVNAVGSLIARTTKLGVYCNAGRENAVASTKAFTSQVTVLALIALWFRQTRDKVMGIETKSYEQKELQEALMRLPITFGMAMKTHDACKEVAKRLNPKEHCFVLGKGYGEPVAYEGALKIKEMCYLHAEGYSGGALKHGPFALIEGEKGVFGSTPIILLIFDDEHAHHMRTAAEEVKARGADLIIITDKHSLAEGLCDDPIVVPHNGPLTALGAVLPLQFIAYELALLRGINPDTPRNLAKAVTVD